MSKIYDICLVYEDGTTKNLSIRGRTQWKARTAAKKHAHSIAGLKTRAGIMKGLVCVDVEDEMGRVVEHFEVKL